MASCSILYEIWGLLGEEAEKYGVIECVLSLNKRILERNLIEEPPGMKSILSYVYDSRSPVLIPWKELKVVSLYLEVCSRGHLNERCTNYSCAIHRGVEEVRAESLNCLVLGKLSLLKWVGK